jgi:hypothetical protein
VRRAVLVACVLASLSFGGTCESSDSGVAVVTEEAETAEVDLPEAPGVELPDPVAKTQAAIFNAANARDWEALRDLISPATFLSDVGFGVDPIEHWQTLGWVPLEATETLMGMEPTVRETNEGTLYQWPRFTADSSPAEMSADERRALMDLLGEAGLRNAFQEETGYVAPRLGILADGTCWFLILEPAP